MEDIRGVRLRKFNLRKIILGVRMHFRHKSRRPKSTILSTFDFVANTAQGSCGRQCVPAIMNHVDNTYFPKSSPFFLFVAGSEPSPCAKFHIDRCDVLSLPYGSKTPFLGLSKRNTGMPALRTVLPVACSDRRKVAEAL